MAELQGLIDYSKIRPPRDSNITLVSIGGAPVTARDWSADLAKLQNLDIALSSLAPDLAKLQNLDIALSSLTPSRSTATLDLSNYSLAGGGSVNVVKNAGSGWSALVATIRVTYASSATAGVRVVWLYSPDGTNFDTVDDAVAQGNYYDLSFAASATRQATVLIPLLAPYVRVQVINKDSTNAATVNMWTLLLR